MNTQLCYLVLLPEDWGMFANVVLFGKLTSSVAREIVCGKVLFNTLNLFVDQFEELLH